MSLNRIKTPKPEGEKAPYINVPKGEYEGRLVYVADLGLQERNYKGDEKPPAQQIALGIELCGLTYEYEGEQKPRIMWTKPFNIFSKMDEKSNEYMWYKVFDPSAVADTVADWDAVLGAPCSVHLTHRQGKGEHAEKVFDEISMLTAVPKKYQADHPEAVTEPCIGDAEDENNAATQAMFGLTKFVWNKRIPQATKPKPKAATVAPKPTVVDDKVPF